jgi:hypothetical protein
MSVKHSSVRKASKTFIRNDRRAIHIIGPALPSHDAGQDT